MIVEKISKSIIQKDIVLEVEKSVWFAFLTFFMIVFLISFSSENGYFLLLNLCLIPAYLLIRMYEPQVISIWLYQSKFFRPTSRVSEVLNKIKNARYEA